MALEESNWHLCENELPSKLEENYLFYTKNGYYEVGTFKINALSLSEDSYRPTFIVYTPDDEYEFYLDNKNDDNVIAWMELPKFKIND